MYPISPRSPKIHRHVGQASGLTAEQMDTVIAAARGKEQQANLAGQVQDSEVRRSRTHWLRYEPGVAWLYERLANLVGRTNAEHWRFDLAGFGESFQITLYDSAEEGFYDWHMDMGAPGITRKLTTVIQLTDPADYDGGNLEIFCTNTVQSVHKERGWAVTFPSFVMHRVSPVTRGERWVLVAWTCGPAFR